MSQIGLGPGAVAEPFQMDWLPIGLVAAVLLIAVFYLFAPGRPSFEARVGLALGMRGLLGKEIRSRSRGWRSMLILTGYLGLLTVAIAGFLSLIGSAGGTIAPTIGAQLFSALATGSVLLLAFITPALTVGAVSGERERRTLDLLLVTRSSSIGLACGKMAGSLLYVLFLLAASLPAFAVVYLFGGVPALYLVMVMGVAAMTALAHASLGLFLSALLRRTIVASVVAYLVVLFVVFGIPFVSTIATIAHQARAGGQQFPGVPPAYLFASPLASLASVMPMGSPELGMPLVGDLLRIFLIGASSAASGMQPTGNITQVVYVVSVDQMTGQTHTVTRLAPWVYYFVFSGVFAFICLVLSALLLAPVKPWRSWRIRRTPNGSLR